MSVLQELSTIVGLKVCSEATTLTKAQIYHTECLHSDIIDIFNRIKHG